MNNSYEESKFLKLKLKKRKKRLVSCLVSNIHLALQYTTQQTLLFNSAGLFIHCNSVLLGTEFFLLWNLEMGMQESFQDKLPLFRLNSATRPSTSGNTEPTTTRRARERGSLLPPCKTAFFQPQKRGSSLLSQRPTLTKGKWKVGYEEHNLVFSRHRTPLLWNRGIHRVLKSWRKGNIRHLFKNVPGRNKKQRQDVGEQYFATPVDKESHGG